MVDPDQNPRIKMRIHKDDDWRVDGILRLIEEARKQGPLGAVLKTMCEQVAVIAHADIVSVYVREPSKEGDILVMRANVGFPASAVGHVQLRLGEGITGTAAEVMRPISASVVAEDRHYKYIPELGEEKYPSFLAIPLLVRGAAAGVLVLQRSEANAFAQAEVALATALATTFGHALEAARTKETTEFAPRSARLVGMAQVPGVALGRAVMLGTLEAVREQASAIADPAVAAQHGFEDIAGMIRRGLKKLEPKLPDDKLRRLRSHTLMLDDQRLRDTMQEQCGRLGLVPGLKRVAREYAVATYVTGEADPLLEERATEVESLCLLVAAAACEFLLPGAGSVLIVAERLTAVVALVVSSLNAVAIASAGRLEPDSLGVCVARAANIPVLCDVSGLFAWVRPDDSVLVDSDNGILRVNPSATQIARYRHTKPPAGG
ncbi:MAG TPA: GAF domain-containing protein [Polyangiales bacterium]|nr:GAF domain-containing protein [Polyangiales bacterium]